MVKTKNQKFWGAPQIHLVGGTHPFTPLDVRSPDHAASTLKVTSVRLSVCLYLPSGSCSSHAFLGRFAEFHLFKHFLIKLKKKL